MDPWYAWEKAYFATRGLKALSHEEQYLALQLCFSFMIKILKDLDNLDVNEEEVLVFWAYTINS